MTEINLVQSMHASTKRNYVQRVVEHDKAESAEVARQFGRDYWDGERRYGYGGYRYDGRWRPLAQTLIDRYGIKPGMSVLDVGCGKGFLLYEFTQLVPDLKIAGIDISQYGIDNAKEEVRPLSEGRKRGGTALPRPQLRPRGLARRAAQSCRWKTCGARSRKSSGSVAAPSKYLMVESFRNEREKANLLYWQLTCLSFHSPETWAWIYAKCGYTGDHGFIFFE